MSGIRRVLLAIVMGVCVFGAAPKKAEAYTLAFYGNALAADAFTYSYYGYVTSPAPSTNEYYGLYWATYGYQYANYAYVYSAYQYNYDASRFCAYASGYAGYAYNVEAKSVLWFFAAFYGDYASDACLASYYYSQYGA